MSRFTDAAVPATLQATIGDALDRLGATAKITLNAAAVVGSRFGVDLLTALGVEPVGRRPVGGPAHRSGHIHRGTAEYVFHHPLIRAVAYEAQLKSDRAELHRRVADRDRTNRSRVSSTRMLR